MTLTRSERGRIGGAKTAEARTPEQRSAAASKAARSRFYPPLAERFWAKVAKSEGCWRWLGASSRLGYGTVRIDHVGQLAHRVAWELERGPIPPGLCVLHRCDNPSCVRPDHLFLGTMKENTQDMMRKGRHRYGAPARGSAVKNSKLTEAQAAEILALRGKVMAIHLAERYGVSVSTVSLIHLRRRWAHVGSA